MRGCGRGVGLCGLRIVTLLRLLAGKETIVKYKRRANEVEVRIEYLERFGEGSILRQAYLDGGKKMD